MDSGHRVLQVSCGKELAGNQYAVEWWDVMAGWCLGLQLLAKELQDLIYATHCLRFVCH